MKVLAIGDIHTKIWIIDKVSEIVNKYDRVILIGDYADEWNMSVFDNIKTWEAVKAFQETYKNVITLMGNHDYDYVRPSHNAKRLSEMTYLILGFPENRDLKDWVTDLPISVVLDDVTYSHAGITEKWLSLEEKDLYQKCSPIWARPGYNEYVPGKQVFGHTPQKTCKEVKPEAWCIDTFSKDPYGRNIGDNSVLEIINGKEFNVIEL